jgi:hypothetical protein
MKGWKFESHRHMLAAKGVKTLRSDRYNAVKYQERYTPEFNKMGEMDVKVVDDGTYDQPYFGNPVSVKTSGAKFEPFKMESPIEINSVKTVNNEEPRFEVHQRTVHNKNFNPYEEDHLMEEPVKVKVKGEWHPFEMKSPISIKGV